MTVANWPRGRNVKEKLMKRPREDRGIGVRFNQHALKTIADAPRKMRPLFTGNHSRLPTEATPPNAMSHWMPPSKSNLQRNQTFSTPFSLDFLGLRFPKPEAYQPVAGG